MKILCLHGYGTSGAILETQLAALRMFSDDTCEFVFLDGEVECEPARGLEASDGPFLCYYDDFAPANVASACTLIDGMIEDEGPFDGILGFSQGGSLALSYLLQHELEYAGMPSPFAFAILCSPVMAFSPSEAFAADILKTLTAHDLQVLSDFPHSNFARLQEPRKRIFCETLATTFETARNGGFIRANTDGGSFSAGGSNDNMIPRVMHPALLPEGVRIRIPTVHLTGSRDDAMMVKLSKLMMQACDMVTFREIEHGGGHDLPKDARCARMAARAMDWAHESAILTAAKL